MTRCEINLRSKPLENLVSFSVKIENLMEKYRAKVEDGSATGEEIDAYHYLLQAVQAQDEELKRRSDMMRQARLAAKKANQRFFTFEYGEKESIYG